jgi:hypothetical protein
VPPSLRCEVQGRHALAVVGAAEGSTLIHVRTEVDQLSNRGHASVRGRPGERGAAVGIGVDTRAELDEQRQRLDPIGLRRPYEPLVEHLLRIVGGLPGGEAAVGAVVNAVSAGQPCSRKLANQVEVAEACSDTQVARLGAEQVDDISMPPEERCDERCPAVTARGEIGARAGLEHHLRELAPVRVTGLVEFCPAVVVATVRIGAACEQQADEIETVGHAEQVVAVRAANVHEIRVPVKQLRQAFEVVALYGLVGEHERRLRQRLDVSDELGPVGEAVPAGKLDTRLVDADAARGRDPEGAAFVVLDVAAKRLLEAHGRGRF